MYEDMVELTNTYVQKKKTRTIKIEYICIPGMKAV